MGEGHDSMATSERVGPRRERVRPAPVTEASLALPSFANVGGPVAASARRDWPGGTDIQGREGRSASWPRFVRG